MECYEEFPISTVVYNGITLGGALAVGVVLMAQFGVPAMSAYVLLLLVAGTGLLALICSGCGYYGHRCPLGLGRAAAWLFKKGQEDQFFRTVPQFVVGLVLVIAVAWPIVIGGVLLVRDFTVGRLFLLAAMAGLLLVGLTRHPKHVCSHCMQGKCGACPIGRSVWEIGE